MNDEDMRIKVVVSNDKNGSVSIVQKIKLYKNHNKND